MRTSTYLTNTLLAVVLSMVSLTAFAQDDAAQADPCSKTGPDERKTMQEYSLFNEFYKQDNIKDAFKHWKYVYYNAPGFRETTHIRGVSMYQDKLDALKKADKDDSELYAATLDTLRGIYEKRIECFGDKDGSTVGRLGYDLYKYQPTKTEDNLKMLKRSVDKGGNNTEYFVIQAYIITIEKAVKKDMISQDELLEEYFKVSDIMNYNIKNNAKKASKYESVKEFIDNRMLAYVSCEVVIPRIKKEYATKKDDKEFIKKAFAQLGQLRCFDDALTIELAEKMATIEPSEDIYRVIGFYYQKNNNYTKAIDAFKKVLDFADSDAERGEYLMDIAKMYRSQGDYPSARNYAQQAAAKKGGWGEPYLLIGDLYRGSGKKCGSGTGWDSQVVTWPAVDMYERAKSVDPSVAAKANQKIADTKKYMPSQGECFFRNLKQGDSYSVGCWIGVTTTVRYGPDPE